MTKKRMVENLVMPPKEGRKKSAGHGMGGMFGAGPKKPEADMPPRTRAGARRARRARLANKFI